MKYKKTKLLILLIISCLLVFSVSCTPKQEKTSIAEDLEATSTPIPTATIQPTTPILTVITTLTPTPTTTQKAKIVVKATPKPTVKAAVKITPKPVVKKPTPAPPQNTTKTFTGIIIDEDCFVQYTKPGDDVGVDTSICLRMKTCAASGYGIAILQSNKAYKFYYFDGSFMKYNNTTKKLTSGTGAQMTSWNLVNATTKKNHVTISVKGTLSGKTRVSPYDGKSYPVINVSRLSER